MTSLKWTKDEKARAAASYALCGNATKAAKAAGVPRTTVSTWLNEENTDFIRYLDEATEEFDRALPGVYSEILEKAAKQVLDKLASTSAAQAMTIAAIAHDKRALALGKPTSISSRRGEPNLDEVRKMLEAAGRDDRGGPVTPKSSSRKKGSLLQ